MAAQQHPAQHARGGHRTAVQLEVPCHEHPAGRGSSVSPPHNPQLQPTAGAHQGAGAAAADAAVHVVRHAGSSKHQKELHRPPPCSHQPPAWRSLLQAACRCPRMLLWEVVLPTSTLAVVWDAVMLLLILYLALLLPYAVAFDIDYTDLHNPWAQLDLAASVLFLWDVWLNFRLAYIGDDGQVVTSRRRIAGRYLRGWCVFDVLSSVPYEQLITITAYGIPAFVTLLKLVRGLRILKVVRLVKLLRMARVVKQPQVLSRLEWVVGRPITQLATMCAAVFLLLHWVACAWFFVAVLGDDDNWVVATGLSDADDGVKYVSALYWSISTAATIGFGDIVAHSLREKLLAVVVMLVGASVFGWFMAAMSVMVSATNSNRDRMATKRRAVDDFLSHRKLPPALAERVRRYCAYVIEREVQSDEADIIAGLSASLRTQVVYHLYTEALEKVPFFRGQTPQFITSVVTFLKLEYYAPNDVVVRQGDAGSELYWVVAGSLEVGVTAAVSAAALVLDRHPQVRLYEDEGGAPLSHPTYRCSPTRAGLRSQKAPAPGGSGGSSEEEGGAQRQVLAIDHQLPAQGGRRRQWTYVDELTDRPFRTLGELHAGQHFGEQSCLLGRQHPATVVARSYVELYSLNRSDLDTVLQHYPDLVAEFEAMVSREGQAQPVEQPPSPLAAVGSPLARWNMARAACQQHAICSSIGTLLPPQQQEQASGPPNSQAQQGPGSPDSQPEPPAGAAACGCQGAGQRQEQQHACSAFAAGSDGSQGASGCCGEQCVQCVDGLGELPRLATRSAASVAAAQPGRPADSEAQQRLARPGSCGSLGRSSAPLQRAYSSSGGRGLARVSPTAGLCAGLDPRRPSGGWGVAQGSGLFRSNSQGQYLFPAFQDSSGTLRPQSSAGSDLAVADAARQAFLQRRSDTRLSGGPQDG